MDVFTLSIVLILFSGFFQGTFGLGMRRFAPLAWEAFWLIFAVVGMIVIPTIWALATVPHPWDAIATAGTTTVVKVMLFGACWGIGALMFGLAVNYLGMSLTYGVTMGLAAVVGSIVPLVRKENFTFDNATVIILVGNLVMVVGVALMTWAGIDRDRLQAARGKSIAGIQTGWLFWLGLFFCVFNGVAAALLNIGFAYAEPIARAAVEQGANLSPAAQAALQRNASIVQWVVLFWGGAIVNVAYVLYLLARNKSYRTYFSRGAARGYFWALATTAMWFLALAFYGQGAALMGEYGNVVGWTMFLALSLVVSNAWGILGGEWKDVRRPLATIVFGNFVLVASTILLGYANSLR
ncbi:MAG: hypothetical protein JW959_10575 [Pirellulales bacterium]|nr:hypothetical protein [Pirellulales bacterium]